MSRLEILRAMWERSADESRHFQVAIEHLYAGGLHSLALVLEEILADTHGFQGWIEAEISKTEAERK